MGASDDKQNSITNVDQLRGKCSGSFTELFTYATMYYVNVMELHYHQICFLLHRSKVVSPLLVIPRKKRVFLFVYY